MSARRIAAIGAVLFGAAAVGLALVAGVQEFPRSLATLAALAAAAAGAWYAIVRRGLTRILSLITSVVGLAVAVVLISTGGGWLRWALIGGAIAISSACARIAFAAPARPPEAAARRGGRSSS